MPDLGRFNHFESVVNPDGEKTAVIVPMDDFRELLEDIQDLALVAERRDEKTIPHDELISALKRDGFLQD